MPDFQCVAQGQGYLALACLGAGDLGEASRLVGTGLAMVRAKRILGHNGMDLLLAATALALLKAEAEQDRSRATALLRSAERCSRAAVRRARVFRGGLAPALRMKGTLEWLRKREAEAIRLWAESRDEAERLGATFELGATLIEAGTRTGDEEMIAAGRALFGSRPTSQ
jgi:hypothetical protein